MKFKLSLGINPGSTVYLQNNADWFGHKLSSSILSCDFDADEGMDRSQKLVRFIESQKNGKPLKWDDVMARRSFFDESYDHELAGDLLRDKCKEVRSVEMSGGFLFGGFDGLKYMHEPTMTINEADEKMWKWKRPVILLTCSFKGKHECKVNLHKDNMERLKKTQGIIQKTFLRQEVKKWRDHPSKKAKKIVGVANGLLDEIIL